jgi:hypothetical protein
LIPGRSLLDVSVTIAYEARRKNWILAPLDN